MQLCANEIGLTRGPVLTSERICQVIATVIAVAVGAAWLWLMLTDNRVEEWTERHQRAIEAFFQEGK